MALNFLRNTSAAYPCSFMSNLNTEQLIAWKPGLTTNFSVFHFQYRKKKKPQLGLITNYSWTQWNIFLVKIFHSQWTFPSLSTNLLWKWHELWLLTTLNFFSAFSEIIITISEGVFSVMAITIENGISNPSSNPEQGCLHFNLH